MIARKLDPGEIYLSRRNMAVCFEGEFDLPAELEKAKTEQADPKEDHWGAFAGSPQDPVASLVMNHYTVRFDGHWVPMGGVGGVASLPAYRRGGAIRACMRAALKDLRERGSLFSSLYPFSTAFYAQFGYAPGAMAYRWNLRLKDLARLPEAGGWVRQLFPGDDLAPLTEVYRQVYGEINLGVRREEYAPWMREGNFLGQKRQVFVWFDGDGKPGAFLMGSRDRNTLLAWPDFPRKSDGLLFRDAEALRGLLRFVYTAFQANYQSIEFVVPGHLDLMGMLPELSDMNCHAIMNGMLRLVNVEEGLRLCRCRGAGEVTLGVTDPLLPENEGAFRLAFGPEGNRVERVDSPPDLTLSVGALSQLLAGVKAAGDLPWMDGVQIHRENPDLEGVFYRKPCHILDLF